MLTLCPDVHACEIGRTAVFLDVPRDRYVRLTQQQSEWLAQVTRQGPPPAPGSDAARFGARLVELGLMQAPSRDAASFAPLRRPAPRASVYDQSFLPAATATDAFRMIRALMGCARVVRRRRLSPALSAAVRWKGALPDDLRPDTQAALEKARAFHALSPYFFTARDKCLFRSLVLARFLAYSQIRCDWVFAVRLSPFEAHCWLEHDGTALNEHTDKTQEFCPVLVV